MHCCNLLTVTAPPYNRSMGSQGRATPALSRQLEALRGACGFATGASFATESSLGLDTSTSCRYDAFKSQSLHFEHDGSLSATRNVKTANSNSRFEFEFTLLVQIPKFECFFLEFWMFLNLLPVKIRIRIGDDGLRKPVPNAKRRIKIQIWHLIWISLIAELCCPTKN